MRSTRLLCLVGLLFLAPVARGADADAKEVAGWAHWRGPAYNGTSPATGLPDKISPDSNLLWSVALPGPSNATPTLFGGHVYVSAYDANKKLRALSIDAASGKIEWNNEIADAPGANARNNTYATPSAAADEKGATFLFGTGDLIAYDTAGKVRWSRKLPAEFGKVANDWIYSSSTLLFKDTLYMQVLQRSDKYGESYIAAINAEDGKTKWRVNRPTTAVGESRDSYATPIPLVLKDSTQILVLGGDCVTAHDPETGKELWRYGGFNPQQRTDWRTIPSPVADADRAYICVARGKTTIAVNTGGSGDVSATHKAWSVNTAGSDSPSPALSNGVLYVLDDKRTLHALDAATGAQRASVALGGMTLYSASPTVADGKIYLMNEAAEVVILAADTLKVLSRVTLSDKGIARATITVLDGKVFIRTATKLWCFGK